LLKGVFTILLIDYLFEYKSLLAFRSLIAN